MTSRGTRRWVLPKGNPMRGLADHQAAAHEAYEEAGVAGIAARAPIGVYRYLKERQDGSRRTAAVTVFPLQVTAPSDDWPEAHQRERRWFSLADAAAAVDEPALRALIAGFAPVHRRSGRPVLTAVALAALLLAASLWPGGLVL